MLKNRRVRSCICKQFLTFRLLSYILLQVVLFSSFRADEKQKARHTGFASHSLLGSHLCIDNTALSHPVRCKLRLHYARLYAGGIVDLQSKFLVFRSFDTCVCHFDNTALSHPVRHNLRLHYARLYAGGIVDLQSKFVLIPQLELTRAVAQTVPVFFLDYLLLVDCSRRGWVCQPETAVVSFRQSIATRNLKINEEISHIRSK